MQGKTKMLVPDEPLASIVREALLGYASGRFETQAEVQRFLESQPEYPRVYRGGVHAQRVYDMLTQVLYAGHLEFTRWNVSLRKAKHQGLITFEDFLKIRTRMTSTAKAPARADLNRDFPLRGAIACVCGTPLTGYWAKGRSKHYAYYHCHNKACEHYGQTIKRDQIEGEFERFLGDLRPSPSLFALAYDTFRTLWEQRIGSAKERKKEWDVEARKIEKDVTQLLDRIVDTDSQTLIRAYEGRINALEIRKVELREKIAKSGKPARDFDSTFRTAMGFLANPQKLWVSGSFQHKRLVLKLTFAERLQYLRGSGFRTAVTTSPFSIFSSLDGGGREMVPARGFEPLAP